MIEIFKTNVETPEDAALVKAELLTYLPQSEINFDLEDCDRILRVKGTTIIVEKIIQVLNEKRYECEILE